MAALAPYQRIAAKIRERIDNGELQPGDRIPSVREIMATEGVSSATATRVAGVLRQDGYAETVQGIGTVACLPAKLTTGPDRLTMLRATGDGLKQGERTEIVGAELVPASSAVADALGVDEGSQVVQRRRVYYDTLGVATVSTSWLRGEFAEAAPELVRAEPLPTMTFGLVEERTGRRASRRRNVVKVQATPDDVAAILGVEPGTRVLTVINTYWDQDGEPTEHAVDYFSPGRELVDETAI